MSTIRAVVAAATAIVGADLVTAEPLNSIPSGRTLDTLSLTGSTAVGDCIVELVIGTESVGKYANTSTGLVDDAQKDLRKIGKSIPANARVQVYVRDAADTNPVVATLNFSDRSQARSYSKRRAARAPARPRRPSRPRGAGGFF